MADAEPAEPEPKPKPEPEPEPEPGPEPEANPPKKSTDRPSSARGLAATEYYTILYYSTVRATSLLTLLLASRRLLGSGHWA